VGSGQLVMGREGRHYRSEMGGKSSGGNRLLCVGGAWSYKFFICMTCLVGYYLKCIFLPI